MRPPHRPAEGSRRRIDCVRRIPIVRNPATASGTTIRASTNRRRSAGAIALNALSGDVVDIHQARLGKLADEVEQVCPQAFRVCVVDLEQGAVSGFERR